AFGRKHENGNRIRVAAQFGAKRKTIKLRHHDIQQNQVRLFRERATEASLAVRGGKHAIVFADEHVGEGGAHGQFVFDDQDAFNGAESSKIEIRSSKQYRKSKFESDDF